MVARRLDRAQRMRIRRVWWERNGAFVRGMLVGAVAGATTLWIVQLIVRALA
jgi:hypothetical protein